jgi:hypothetical protein
MIAFGENDSLYRLGCDWRLYQWRPHHKKNEWKLLILTKVKYVSAYKNELWIIDYQTGRPYEFDVHRK